MKKILLLALPLALFGSCASLRTRSVNTIDEAYVARIIKTLSSDEMEGRATFSKGIDKAATFIEGEFKAAGLSYLPGLKSFRQSFPAYRMKPGATEVIVDGNTIAPENVFVSTDYAGINWNTDPNVTVRKVKAGESFFPVVQGKPVGSFARDPSNKPTLVLLDESFRELFTAARTRGLSRARIATQLNTQSPVVFVLTSLEGKSFRVNFTNVSEQLPLFNVAGMIPGRSKTKEIVLFSAHYDHLGIRPNGAGKDSIYNGADDDASGTTAMIALANYYKKNIRPERTLMFVAFTGEEVGGYGSTYFSKQLNPDDVVAMFNIEMIGKDSKFGPNTAWITGFDRSDFGTILQKNLEGTDFKFHPDPYPKENLFYRSDNATLARLGVPAHSISTDQIDTDPHYHQASDEFATLDVRNILSTIKAIALSSRSIVAGTDTPKRIPKQATGF